MFLIFHWLCSTAHWPLPSVCLPPQHMERCSWWGRWVATMPESCTPWRFWKRPLLCRRQRLLNTRALRGKCWSTSASPHSSSHFTTPSRRIPSCTSFSVRTSPTKLPSTHCRLPCLCFSECSERGMIVCSPAELINRVCSPEKSWRCCCFKCLF